MDTDLAAAVEASADLQRTLDDFTELLATRDKANAETLRQFTEGCRDLMMVLTLLVDKELKNRPSP